MLSSRTELIH